MEKIRRPLPDVNLNPQTAQEALTSLVQLQAAQVQMWSTLREEIEEQGRAITDLANDVEKLRKNDNADWKKTRGYIAFAFWWLIGVPIICSGTVVLLLSTGALSSFVRR